MTRFNSFSVSFGCIAIALLAVATGCRAPESSAPALCVTVPPLGMIVERLAQGGPEVVTLLPAGASPHTYDVSPSNARTAASSRALLYVGAPLDGWAARLQARTRVQCLDLLLAEQIRYYDAHDGGVPDPHFWLDPVVVRELVPALADRLAEIDPEHASTYRANAEAFRAELDALHLELSEWLAPVRGAAVAEHHPSMEYFLARYGLEAAGAVEESPGHEPSPRDLERLADTMRAKGVRAILNEPQLPRAPVEALAEVAGAAVVDVDPVGGVAGRETYADLLRFNARALAEALR